VTYDVAIVGYGPVGQALAILLAQRGWRVGVFEKQPQAYPLPRAVHFDHEVGRILQACGVAARIRGRTEPTDSYEWRNAAGATLLRFESGPAGLSGWPDGNMFAQPDLEAILDARARTLPGLDVARGVEVVDLVERTDAVQLTCATAGGATRDVDPRFVVGCDGANSFVRTSIGSTVTDLGFFFDWLIVDVVPNAPTVWRPLNIQVCDPARPTTLVSGGPGRRRWEFMRLPGEDIDDLNREETAWRLLAASGVTPENARLERHTVYRFQARWVDEWRKGRVLLAGDAAHQMPPFAGQGMCSGLRDAANLAWKLDLVLRAAAPAALLDTYESERVPHVRAVIDFSMALGKVICIADPVEAAGRDAMMTAALASGQQATPPPSPTIGPGVLRVDDPHAGKLFPQGRVRTADGREGWFDDVVGGGWALLGRDGDPFETLDHETASWLRDIGVVTAHVGNDASVVDLDGTYARWFEANGAAVVLQRPDFCVFGAEARSADTPVLVAALRRALT
jgi:2-polyprenyl-6-methoxyphenol hydroxylase-like FAD-dependent oxidoreductase